jgi:hypothetical protein
MSKTCGTHRGKRYATRFWFEDLNKRVSLIDIGVDARIILKDFKENGWEETGYNPSASLWAQATGCSEQSDEDFEFHKVRENY